jgi:hypothetical protein
MSIPQKRYLRAQAYYHEFLIGLQQAAEIGLKSENGTMSQMDYTMTRIALLTWRIAHGRMPRALRHTPHDERPRSIHR